jgi:hypothetical protein
MRRKDKVFSKAGFKFVHPNLTGALADLLGNRA